MTITPEEVLGVQFIMGALESAASADNDLPETTRIFAKDLLVLAISYFQLENPASLSSYLWQFAYSDRPNPDYFFAVGDDKHLFAQLSRYTLSSQEFANFFLSS